MGISVDYCLAVPDIYYEDAEICATVQDNPVQIGSRDCYYGSSSDLYSVDATLLSENLGPASFDFGFWVGVEVKSSNNVCLWLGNEDWEVCVSRCTTHDSITDTPFIEDVAAQFVNELIEEIDIDAVKLLGSIIVAVIVFIVSTILSPILGAAGA
jgi:hypothetical protein